MVVWLYYVLGVEWGLGCGWGGVVYDGLVVDIWWWFVRVQFSIFWIWYGIYFRIL